MKRFLILLALCLPLMGCPAKTSTTPPALAPGYVDSYDQQFAQDIAAAQTYYQDQQKAIEAKTYVPTPTELTALNALGIAINVAKGAAQQYHNAPNTANQATAQNAVNAAKTQQQALSSSGVK